MFELQNGMIAGYTTCVKVNVAATDGKSRYTGSSKSDRVKARFEYQKECARLFHALQRP